MQILKFGGSSISTGDNIIRVTEITSVAAQKDSTIMICSAIAGCTDNLIEAATLAAKGEQEYKKIVKELWESHNSIIDSIIPKDFKERPRERCSKLFNELSGLLEGVYLIKELTPSSLDFVMSFGELFSTAIISARLFSCGVSNMWVDPTTLITTYRENSVNLVDINKTYLQIESFLAKNGARLYVVPGFIAGDSNGRITTLGRGGSDYTASLFAAASNARVLEIWTDVNGMMTTNPNIVPEAKTIEHISYKEALELSHFGAKVIYPPTIQPAIKGGIPIIVRNTFNPNGKSTVIESSPPDSRKSIRGISGSNNIALISLEGSGMIGIPGYSARFFTSLAKEGINIILITQASSLHTMCVAISEESWRRAGKVVDEEFAYEISLGKVNPVTVERGFSIISLVGDDMKNQSGTGGIMFKALGDAGINIRAIAQGSSEKNISVIVGTKDYNHSVKLIHDSFFKESVAKKIYLYIAGYGTVGKELVKLIESQRKELILSHGVDIVIAGLCTSKKMLFSKTGLLEQECKEIYSVGKGGDNNKFIGDMLNQLPGKGVFVDCTASDMVASCYSDLLSNSISVVTCNKIAPSSTYSSWGKAKEIARLKGVSLLYETTAGAALPIIETISRLIESGEKITKIEAILSGTLNYIYSSYNGSISLDQLVLEAKERGYTEPDPAIDLSGVDVLRKCTILARECGFKIEQEEIYIEGVKGEPHFGEEYRDSLVKGEKIRYIATIKADGCSVKPKRVAPTNWLYNVNGTDNSITIETENYPSGITITGAGAGARVTAGGVLNDIIKTSK